MAIFTLDDASSRISIALSGKNLSDIYLSDICAAYTNELSEIVRLWYSSYLILSPLNISIVSSTVGWLTETGWNLLSRAGSRSIYLR